MLDSNPSFAHLTTEAFEVASRYRNSDVLPQHLLWAICRTEEGRKAIEDREGDYASIMAYLTDHFAALATGDIDSDITPKYTEEFQRFIDVALTKSHHLQDPLSDMGELIDSMLARCNDFPDLAAALCEGSLVFSAEELSLRAHLEGEREAQDKDDEEGLDFSQSVQGLMSGAPDANIMAVLGSLRNISDAARKKTLDCVIGRHEEIDHIISALERKRKPNVLLVGEPGVGKSALMEGLAMRLLDLEEGDLLKDRPVLEASMTSLMAGTRFRGDFEARMKHLVDFAIDRQAILFIDEGHAIMGTGGGVSGGMDAVTILKPALARGEFSLVIATTPSETRALSKDRALSRRFHKVFVDEPKIEEMKAILGQSRQSFESHHGVLVGETAILEILDKAQEHIAERKFPDKAFDVLDHSASHARRRGAREVESMDIDAAIFDLTGINTGLPSDADIDLAKTLEARINAVVKGQGESVEKFVKSLRLSLLGLSARGGCASAHLFNGPSGVGKTETAKILATSLGIPLVRIDMSEFMDAHSASGLVGAPPGYVGYQDEGVLIAAAEANPRMVLLLDEVDKAHPKVFDLLLQVMDAGRLTSSDGRTVSFRGTHLIMTANIGAKEAQSTAFGFGRERNMDEDMKGAISDHFRPEFLERFNTVLNFSPLNDDAIRLIIHQVLEGLSQRFEEKGFSVSFSDNVATHLVSHLQEGKVSGRRIQRVAENYLADKIALVIMQDKKKKEFNIDFDGQEIVVL